MDARGWDNIKLRTYIRKCSHYTSRGHEAAVKSRSMHTRGNVAGTFIRSSQQGQNVFTHTHSQLQLLRVPETCIHKVSHCLSSSCHTISHLCFVTATCLDKVHLVETSCGMLQQRMLQKGRFLSCEQLGSVRLQLYYRFNQSQTAKTRQYNTFMLTYLR